MVAESVRTILDKYLDQERDIRKLIQQKKEELRLKREVILDLAAEIGERVSFPENDESPTEAKATERLQIRPDTFFGLSQLDAAAKYLDMVGHAVHIDQIVKDLHQGGVKLTARNPRKSLYDQLVRGTRRFTLVGESNFGMRSFYPNKKAETPVAPAKKKSRKKTTTKRKLKSVGKAKNGRKQKKKMSAEQRANFAERMKKGKEEKMSERQQASTEAKQEGGETISGDDGT